MYNHINIKKMKKIIISIIAICFLFAACTKEVQNVSTVVTVTYPTINLIGPPNVLIPVGGAYTDQGATLIDDLTHASSSISATTNTVDNTTTGIYQVTY